MTKYTAFLRLILFAFVLLSMFAGCDSCLEPQVHFDSTKWKEDSTNRHGMIKDVTRNRLKKKMTKADVETLLGKPNAVFPNSGVKENWYYTLVMVDCYNCASLTIMFDDTGVVSRYLVTSP